MAVNRFTKHLREQEETYFQHMWGNIAMGPGPSQGEHGICVLFWNTFLFIQVWAHKFQGRDNAQAHKSRPDSYRYRFDINELCAVVSSGAVRAEEEEREEEEEEEKEEEEEAGGLVRPL